MPTASARPPSVMVFSVWPSSDSTTSERQDRQRDRDHDHQSGAPRAKEQQDHQGGESRGDSASRTHAVIGVA